MSDLYHPVYKCRMCGVVLPARGISLKRSTCIDIITGGKKDYLRGEEIHFHEESDSFGIADLIGFERGETS